MSHIDLEQGRTEDRQLSFGESEDVVSCFHSNTYGYYDYDNDEYSSSVSSVSDESEKSVCRICKLEVGSYGTQGLIELGCSCKGDLAFAHRQCAETWFKLKGNEGEEHGQRKRDDTRGGDGGGDGGGRRWRD
ncbi:hypothetical protein Bca4012_040256 [Brassica carinata]